MRYAQKGVYGEDAGTVAPTATPPTDACTFTQGLMTAWRSLRGRSLGRALDDVYGDPTAKPSSKKDDYAPVPGLSDAGGMPFVFFDFDVRADTAAAIRA